MRKGLLFAAAVVAAITVANAAELSGKIKSIDSAKGTITLSDGMTFVLPKSVKAADLTVGEKVKVTYQAAGKTNAASRVVAAN
jgi:hypothetical protein